MNFPFSFSILIFNYHNFIIEIADLHIVDLDRAVGFKGLYLFRHDDFADQS